VEDDGRDIFGRLSQLALEPHAGRLALDARRVLARERDGGAQLRETLGLVRPDIGLEPASLGISIRTGARSQPARLSIAGRCSNAAAAPCHSASMRTGERGSPHWWGASV
jgi:hypothetical protein